jgi:peptidoglycan hydrolase CwlO-like protein
LRKRLEEEKNALLDYVEESVEKQEKMAKDMNMIAQEIQELRHQKGELIDLIENLKYDDAINQ